MGCGPSVSSGSTASNTAPPAPAPLCESSQRVLAKNRLSVDSREQGDDRSDSPESSLRLLTLDSIHDEEPPYSHRPATTSPMQEFVPLAPMAHSKSQVRSPSSNSRHTILSQGLSMSAVEDDLRSLSQTEVMMADLHAVSASGSSRQLLELAHRLPRQFHAGNNGETGSSCSLVDNDREECERLLDNEDC